MKDLVLGMLRSNELETSRNKKINNMLYVFTATFSILYIGWRIFFTIPFLHGTFSLVCGVLLVIAEAMGIFEMLQQFHGMRVNFEPNKPVIDENEVYPDVDVFIATYNESCDLLYKTINGCLHMEYPDKDKVHIYLCDDSNRIEMKELAMSMNIHYLTRDEHIDAKAGNLNNALQHSTSPLIATFDADMIPLHDFLMETVPYFFLPYYEEKDGVWLRKCKEDASKIGFIQAPQSFYNADLFQYYLYAEANVPNEQDYFYRDVQLARNHSNSPIYGGSNTVISRVALQEIGGFYTGVITEDFATGISIQAKGYTCYAISKILAIGLAPTDLKSLVKQRERWARGCIQTLKRVHFLFKKGLTVAQKISYLSSLLYWYTPFRRLMYIASPILFSLFQMVIVECTINELLLFWLPYYVLHRVALKSFSNDIRNDRWSNVYDTILFPSLCKPVLLETIGISQRKFAVTNKNRLADDRRYQWKMAFPHIILAMLSICAIFKSLIDCFTTNSIYYFIVIFWLIVNLYSLTMSVLFMLGRKAFRNSERFFIQTDVRLRFQHVILMGKSMDLSEGGFSLKFDEPIFIPHHQICHVEIWDDYHGCEVEAELVQVVQMKKGWKYGFRITTLAKGEKSKYFQLIYDRVHTLPQQLKKHNSFFDDLSRNILLRFTHKQQTVSDAVPHIKLDKKLKSDKAGYVVLTDFTYETCRIRPLYEPLQDHLILQSSFHITLDAFRYQDDGDAGYYLIKNRDDLKQNEIFIKILQAWIWEYQEKEKKRIRQWKASRYAVPDDEFDETKLYKEVLV